MRIALFGQAAFGRDVLMRLLEAGHEVAGVYTPPEGKRADPLADRVQDASGAEGAASTEKRGVERAGFHGYGSVETADAGDVSFHCLTLVR